MLLCIRENKEVADPKQCDDSRKHAEDQSLHVKIQAFEDKLEEEVAQGEAETDTPGHQRCHILGQVQRDERRDNRFSRWVGLRSCSEDPRKLVTECYEVKKLETLHKC